MNQLTQQTLRTEIQWLRKHPVDFIRHYGCTDHPLRGILRFPPFPYLQRLIQSFTTHPRLLVLKSRQVCATWSICGYLLHQALFREGGDLLVLSKEHRSAMELLSRVCAMSQRLPQWMQTTVRSKRSELIFPHRRSRILTLPATAEAVRFFTPTLLVWDEMAFTPNADEIWSAISPALDRNARFIGISTPNGSYNRFGKMAGAPETYGFALHRIHYSDRPDRGLHWQNQQKQEVSAAQWRREYELSLEEASGQRVIESFQPNKHVVSEPPSVEGVHSAFKRYRSMDFGYRSPVVLWIAEVSPESFVVFDEWTGTNATREDMLLALRQIDSRWNLTENDFTWSSCDPAGLQYNDSGLPIVDYLSGAGVKLIQKRTLVEDGLDLLRLMFARADGSSQLRISPVCKRLIDDLSSYCYDERTGKPEKGSFDHSVDALRYFVVNRHHLTASQRQSRVCGIQRM